MSHLGKTIGNIRIREILGEGGMGTVYAGFDERLKREVAVKALRGDRLDATTRTRLLREARLLSQLDHPNICRIHEYVEGDDSDYLVLERIRGKDLRRARVPSRPCGMGLAQVEADPARAAVQAQLSESVA